MNLANPNKDLDELIVASQEDSLSEDRVKLDRVSATATLLGDRANLRVKKDLLNMWKTRGPDLDLALDL